MSLIITVRTNDGVVMGSDSRVSFSSPILTQLKIKIKNGHYFDTQEKTFLCKNNVGISTCCSASLLDKLSNNFKNVTGFINDYINNNVQKTTSVFDTDNNLLTFF